MKHMAGAGLGRRREIFLAVYRLQKPALPTLSPLHRQKLRFCC